MQFGLSRPLQIEVLVNSHGPHEQVRVREPFCGLQRLGVDCRLHRHPFLLPKAIRPNSLVIWQRPRPSSWEEQLNILRWIRDRGCILLIEWDDHPDLFPREIKKALKNIKMAPLCLSHGLHTSSQLLAKELESIQPMSFIVPNAIWRIPSLNIKKHIEYGSSFRIFIGNQNRQNEHKKLSIPLTEWCNKTNSIKIVIVGDSKLADSLPNQSVEKYPLLKYSDYRKVMGSCHLALLPLENSLPNNCKTPIKWMEAAAESVAVIGGPGLYKEVIGNNENGLFCETLDQLIPQAKILYNDPEKRLIKVSNSHRKLLKESNLRDLLPNRIKLYNLIWNQRAKLDQILLERFPQASSGCSFKI